MRVLFLFPNSYMSYGIPTGIATLIAVARQAGHRVDLFDFTFIKTEALDIIENPQVFLPTPYTMYDLVKDDPVQSLEEVFENKLKSFNPELIAMTAMTGTFDLGIKLLSKFKGKLNCPVIVGGIHATIDPQDALAPEIVDMICVGEGEDMLLELCERMGKGKDYLDINNLGYKVGGKVHINSLRSLVDIDKLPPPEWSVFDERHLFRAFMGNVYKGSFYVMSRGCPFQCTYCVNGPLRNRFRECGSKYFRYQAPQTTIEQIAHLKNTYAGQWFKFADDSIMGFDEDYLAQLADGLEPLKIQFGCSVRPETTTDRKVALLKRMGCVAASVGIESGNETLRKNILNRRMTNQHIENAVNIIKGHGIRLSTFNMVGLPEETRENVFETIRLNRKIGSKSANVYVIYPYPGTDLYTRYELNFRDQFGKMIPVSKASNFHLSKMNPQEVDGLHRTFHLYLQLDKELWPAIKLAEEFSDKGNSIYKILCDFSEGMQLFDQGRREDKPVVPEIINNVLFKQSGVLEL